MTQQKVQANHAWTLLSWGCLVLNGIQLFSAEASCLHDGFCAYAHGYQLSRQLCLALENSFVAAFGFGKGELGLLITTEFFCLFIRSATDFILCKHVFHLHCFPDCGF